MRLFYLLVLPFLLLFISCHFSPSLLTEEAFCRLYLDTLVHRFPAVKFKMSGQTTIVSEFQDQTLMNYTTNAYNSYKNKPDSIGAILHQYASSAGEVYDMEKYVTADNVVPVIKPVEYLEDMKNVAMEAGAQAKNGKPVELKSLYETYNEDLLICYAIDTRSNIRYMMESDLKKTGLSKDSLRSVAIRNLKRKLGDSVKLNDLGGTYMLTAGGTYEASLILLSDFWSGNKLPAVKGDFVIAIPNRDVLLITGSQNREGIEKMKGALKRTYKKGNYSVSEYLYQWDGKRFTRFQG